MGRILKHKGPKYPKMARFQKMGLNNKLLLHKTPPMDGIFWAKSENKFLKKKFRKKNPDLDSRASGSSFFPILGPSEKHLVRACPVLNL